MKRWKKIPKPCLAHILWKVALIFVPVTFFILGTLQAWGVNQFSFAKAKFCFAGLLGPSLQMWEILLHLLKSTNHHRHNPWALQAPAGSQEWSRELPCAKAFSLLTAQFWMHTASEKLPSLRHFIKEMCETEHTKHKCVNHLKALWTSTNTDNLWGKFPKMCKVSLHNTTVWDTLTHTTHSEKHTLLNGALATAPGRKGNSDYLEKKGTLMDYSL